MSTKSELLCIMYNRECEKCLLYGVVGCTPFRGFNVLRIMEVYKYTYQVL